MTVCGCSTKRRFDHAAIRHRPGDEIADGDAFVIGMPLLDRARTPHCSLRASQTKIAGIERAVAVEDAWWLQSHAPASLHRSAHESAIRCNLRRIHHPATLCFDRPRLADIGGGCNRAEGSVRI